MRELQVVGITSDGKHLILSESGHLVDDQPYLVRLSDELLSRLVGARHGMRTGSPDSSDHDAGTARAEDEETERSGASRERPRPPAGATSTREAQRERSREEPSSRSGSLSASRISPREIQERLRAGQSVEAVAEAADVDPSWVERFAGPVQAELALVLRRAMALRIAKARGGPSALPLGAAVAANLASRGISMSEQDFLESWSAASLGGGRWKVAFAFPAKGRIQHAAWLFDVPARSVKPLDPLANQLGHIGGGEDDAAVPTFVAELVDPPGGSAVDAGHSGTLPLEADPTPPALRRDRGLRALAGPGDPMGTADAEETIMQLIEDATLLATPTPTRTSPAPAEEAQATEAPAEPPAEPGSTREGADHDAARASQPPSGDVPKSTETSERRRNPRR